MPKEQEDKKATEMPANNTTVKIGYAKQVDKSVYVYDEKGQQLWAKGGRRLINYNSNSVTVANGDGSKTIFDEKGNQIRSFW